MIKGMTGFGTTAFSLGRIRGSLEIKSLNHRYLDLSCYLPTGFSSFEDKIRQFLQKYLDRGKITVSVKILDRPQTALSLNKDAARQYLKYASELKREFGFKEQVSLVDLLRFPGVVEVKEAHVEPEEIWVHVEKSLAVALKGLLGMRIREGRSLAAEISSLLSAMLTLNKTIQQRSKAILKSKKTELTPEEFSSFQKGVDVNEEIARLNHYLLEFKKLLKADNAVGKKLDFIAQEMQRETNTMGSKLQDNLVSNSVIALKSKIEKIRELSQNVE